MIESDEEFLCHPIFDKRDEEVIYQVEAFHEVVYKWKSGMIYLRIASAVSEAAELVLANFSAKIIFIDNS